MKLGIRKKNGFALIVIFFVIIVNVLSQSMGMVDEDTSVSPTIFTGSLLRDRFLENQVDKFCSIITASRGETVIFGGNVDLRLQEISEEELSIKFFPPFEEGYGYVTLGRDWYIKGYRTRVNWVYYIFMNEKGLAIAGSGVPPTSLTPHPERPFSGSYKDFETKAMRECSNVASVIELAQNFNWGSIINGQFLIADSTGDAVIISGGRDGELVFTRKEKGDGYLVSTNFNRITPETGNYPCWRYDTASKMLGEIEGEHDLTADYIASILDAIHVENMWVNTAISYIFDLNSGDIYIYYIHQFGEVVKMNVEEEMTEIREWSELTSSVFSADLGSDLPTSHTYLLYTEYSQETREKARSAIQKYKRQYYLVITAGVIISVVVLSGLSLFIYKKVKNRRKKLQPHEEDL
jgi:hypothetical protein